jgi:hypothetical protein
MTNKPLLLASVLVAASSCGDAPSHEAAVQTSTTLTLLREKNLAELLPSGEYEASGVALHGGALRVVFDNRTDVADVDVSLASAVLGPGKKSASQHEGITIATRPVARTYVLTEGAGARSEIVILAANGEVIAKEPTDISFPDADKGLEGIAWLDDIERMLVLCEANSCGIGDDSPGHGKIKSLRHEGNAWFTESVLPLPSIAAFADYSDLAVRDEGGGTYTIAVLSQESSALWLGTLTTKPLAIPTAGSVHGFPKAGGKTQYCSLEGATFLDAKTIALVSDGRKKSDACTKAEAVHVFALP